MDNISLLKLKDEHINNICNSFIKSLKIRNVQAYCPIMSNYFEYYNNSYSFKNFVFKSKYSINILNEEIPFEKFDSYIKFMFKGEVINNYNKKKEDKNIFIKLSPILEVLPYLMNQYNINHNQKMPNIYSYLTNKKINSINNSAYIDSFSLFVLSRLTETGKCPTFPMFYGTFSGVAENFDFDISDEYGSIKNRKWFKDNLDINFTLRQEEHQRLLSECESLNESQCGSLDCDEINDIILPDLEESEIIVLSDNEKDIDTKDCDIKEIKDLKDIECEVIELEVKKVKCEEIELEVKKLDNNDSEWEDVSDEDEEEDDENKDSNSDSKISDETTLSIDSDDLSNFGSYKHINYAQLKDFPVQLSVMELCSKTLDELIEDDDYDLTNTEWKSILFQVCFGMAVAQKHFDFVHNDLHSSNIMLSDTTEEYLYYKFKNKTYKIPTFGKIAKIIDFGRATFKVKDKLYFSDVFKKYGDAEGQYSYPYHNTLRKCKILPNKSFDLARLATTIVEHFQEDNELFNLMKSWATDKYGNSLIYCEDDFDLYKNIALNVCNSVPKDQLNKKVFSEFRIENSEIPKEKFVYIY
jgi:hypothetical protein